MQTNKKYKTMSLIAQEKIFTLFEICALYVV
jgi:hypothetical protein